MEFITKSAQETFNLGKRIGDNLVNFNREENILCLYGELGSGKTTFVQGLAKGLNLKVKILSPTFIVVRHYKLNLKNFSSFYHIDFFRINKNQNLKALGLSEIFSDPKSIIAIEWAEKLGQFLPKNRIDINFEIINDSERKILIKKMTV